MTKSLIVCDIDEVVVNISPKWVYKALHDEHCLLRIRNAEVIVTNRDNPDKFNGLVLDREEYYLEKWLKLPDIVKPHFRNIYAKDGTFYEGLPLTKFGFDLLSNPKSRHVVFISHILSEESTESKRAFIRRNYGKIDHEVHFIPIDKKKSDVVREICPNFDVCIDDHVGNLKDIGSIAKEGAYLLAPALGYTMKNLLELDDVIKTRKLNLQVFE